MSSRYEPLHGTVSKKVYSAHEGQAHHMVSNRSVEVLDRLFNCQFDLVPSSTIFFPTRKMSPFFKGEHSMQLCRSLPYSGTKQCTALKSAQKSVQSSAQLEKNAHCSEMRLKLVYLGNFLFFRPAKKV